MVFAETLLNESDCKINFSVYYDSSDKNNKHISLFYIILIKPQRNYTTTDKKFLSILEFIKQYREGFGI